MAMEEFYRALLVITAVAVLAVAPRGAAAHEVRPAYLEIVLTGREAVILWKQPVAGEFALPLSPVLSNGWIAGPPSRALASDADFLKEWRVPTSNADIAGVTISIDGLDRSITDVLVKITHTSGQSITRVLRPGASSFLVESDGSSPEGLLETIRIGVEHILTGYDHLLFISALMLLVRGLRRLAWTITAFTLGHSVTLAAAVLGYVNVNPAMVEILIALSVLILAVEVVYAITGRNTFASRQPWLVAGGFGLLHGLGFAGSLTRAGLPNEDVASVLFGFNIGVEIGQLTFVVIALTVVWAARRLFAFPLRAALIPAYAIGAMAAYWLIERVADAS
ncbi:HupE/UreJ family protein [Tardiphaga sp. vice352]|nr:HupE/UreJ family protein [Tardiphaga sp. vice154]QDM28433.1 HupE/UreJ family protein [Tardiphaga sp. vice304]QDM33532.1 HupE/UreJ family protein [Tardiphaga sp. vice352]